MPVLELPTLMATRLVQADAMLDAGSLSSPLDSKLYGHRRAKAFLPTAGRGRGQAASAFLSTEDADASFYTSLGRPATGLEESFYIPFGTSHGGEEAVSGKSAAEPESSPLGTSLRSVRRERAWAQLPEETAVLGNHFMMAIGQDQGAQADDWQDQIRTEVQQGVEPELEPAPIGLSQSELDAFATGCDEDDGLECMSERLLHLKRLKAFGDEVQARAKAAVFKEEEEQAEAVLLEGLSTTGSSCSSWLPQSMLDRLCSDEDADEEDQPNEEEDSLLLQSRRARSFSGQQLQHEAMGGMLPQPLVSADASLAKTGERSMAVPMLNLTADCEFGVSYRGPSSLTHGGA
eukprot:TRINITY_DN57735_c0_g1_i1.p1 TRINITY_DN57735_c0_g1~~TRINITY_DN57735_c0_g1_i1.p1  ORF type:complete len:347 (+),score=87.55 TRINITY_DN57735_c0_g1_i1:66-1106(+)